MPGNDQNWQGRIAPFDFIEQVQPVELGAFEPDIKQNERRAAVGNGCECRIAICGHARGVAVILQNPGDKIANVGFVINDQNIKSHGSLRLHARQGDGSRFSWLKCTRFVTADKRSQFLCCRGMEGHRHDCAAPFPVCKSQ